jgi:hypothetical protein
MIVRQVRYGNRKVVNAWFSPPFSSIEALYHNCKPTTETRGKRSGVALSPPHDALYLSNNQALIYKRCNRRMKIGNKRQGVAIDIRRLREREELI